MRPTAAAALLLICTLSAPAADPAADAKLLATAKTLFAGLKKETLPNGLRVYLLPVPVRRSSPRWSPTRSARATRTRTRPGLSHYLEHLLFKGTDKLMPGDIDRATQRNGGRNNAYTSEDMTVYHFDFAADRWQIGAGDRSRPDAEHAASTRSTSSSRRRGRSSPN